LGAEVKLSSLPPDYSERVYAAVLGKIIGVYLGRPFEQWTHERIDDTFGEVHWYVNDQTGAPLIVADDDITGSFTFVRALEDCGDDPNLTAEQIGEAWLNYIVENRTILWWGGLGNSTEHTAYLRLKSGIKAPRSGSEDLNTKLVAEQIGSQIFIDPWGLLHPNDPETAADFAKRAALVSHDGEAVYGAQVVAALVAGAFGEKDLNRLLDRALALVPSDSTLYRMAQDVREWHGRSPGDWRAGLALIQERYGYDTFGGNCHIIPNHALILHSLLHGGGSLARSLMIVNTCGWDTDCNSGNVGCILGALGGLEAFDQGPDYRSPVADRILLPTADGASCITDAVIEAQKLEGMARRMRGLSHGSPKQGARFHFTHPGSVQGWQPSERPEHRGALAVSNQQGQLLLACQGVAEGRSGAALTPTFATPTLLQAPGYGMAVCPTLYPGQVIEARISALPENKGVLGARLLIGWLNCRDEATLERGPEVFLHPGTAETLTWETPEFGGWPIQEVGVELFSSTRSDDALLVDSLTWTGSPKTSFRRPVDAPEPGWGMSPVGLTWRRAWVDAVDHFDPYWEAFRLVQNRGEGMIIQGGRDWTDYRVESAIVPHMAQSWGLAARVQGLRRWYGLILEPGRALLVKQRESKTVLASADLDWRWTQPLTLALQVEGSTIAAWVDGRELFRAKDLDRPFLSGGVGLVVEEGRIATEEVSVSPCGSD
jgi:ADP-ribosylglycohydrolase